MGGTSEMHFPQISRKKCKSQISLPPEANACVNQEKPHDLLEKALVSDCDPSSPMILRYASPGQDPIN
jgi:hypothetical protein